MARKKKSPAERFWALVDKTNACWLWTGARVNGYGKFAATHDRTVSAHRYVFELLGIELTNMVVVDHLCHNPSCVRYEHLRLVSQSENTQHRRGPNKNNGSSRIRGVSWSKASSKWVVQVKHDRINHYGGLFAELADAEAAAIALRNELFTHNNADRAFGNAA